MVTRFVFRTATALGLATSVLCTSACGPEEQEDPPPVAEPQPQPGDTERANDTKLLPELEGEAASMTNGTLLKPVVRTGDSAPQENGSPCEERRPPHTWNPHRPGDRFDRAALQPACREDARVAPVLPSPVRTTAPPETLANIAGR
jgi:hypothetical protein